MLAVQLDCEVCGEPVHPRSDRQVRYCTRQCAGIAKRGRSLTAHPLYNGGLCQRPDRRWVINCRDGSLLLYSRAVMAAAMGRLLGSHELVHHDNEDPSDDRPENLILTTRVGHIEIHRDQLLAARGLKRR